MAIPVATGLLYKCVLAIVIPRVCYLEPVDKPQALDPSMVFNTHVYLMTLVPWLLHVDQSNCSGNFHKHLPSGGYFLPKAMLIHGTCRLQHSVSVSTRLTLPWACTLGSVNRVETSTS